MIGLLTGSVLVIGSDEVVLDVSGVGYLVKCGTRTLSALSVGAQASLHIETHVREQAITLFGFHDDEERAWFVRLQSVQKLGPKAALAILDILRPDEIINAVAMEDKASFHRAKGVGPALAGRIIVDLSGKAPPMGRGFLAIAGGGNMAAAHAGKMAPNAASPTGLQRDASSALCNLGIDQSSAMRAVALALRQDENLDLNGLVKAALKEIGP